MVLKKLFGNYIEPACQYCCLGRDTSDGQKVLCEKAGVVLPSYSCKKFIYDPLKRIPTRQVTKLPPLEQSDFKL